MDLHNHVPTHIAARWCRDRSKTTRRHYGSVVSSHPTTAELRRWLRDPATPRGIKNHLYEWLNYRRSVRWAR